MFDKMPSSNPMILPRISDSKDGAFPSIHLDPSPVQEKMSKLNRQKFPHIFIQSIGGIQQQKTNIKLCSRMGNLNNLREDEHGLWLHYAINHTRRRCQCHSSHVKEDNDFHALLLSSQSTIFIIITPKAFYYELSKLIFNLKAGNPQYSCAIDEINIDRWMDM